MAQALSLSEQTVLITGAANGLGLALATAFHQTGASLVLLDYNQPALDRLASTFPQAGLYRVDLSEADATRRVLAEILARYPTIDTLIHNAGFLERQSFLDMSPERWDLTFNVGIQAACLITRAFWPRWLESGAVAIFVSSNAGIRGQAGEVAYTATKHALEGFVKALAAESSSAGILVYSITPGALIRTPMSEQNYDEERKASWVDPIELTPAFLHLACREAPALSGTRLSAWDLSRQVENLTL